MPEVPIEDAVTVAYVDVVHAMSELDHIDWDYDNMSDVREEIDQALEDLRNALVMLNPHVRAVEPDPERRSAMLCPITEGCTFGPYHVGRCNG